MLTRLAILFLFVCGFSAKAASSPATLFNPGTRDYLVHVWQTEEGLPQNWVSSIAQTPDGYLWVGTRYGGLARFDGVRFVTFTPQNTPQLKDVQVEHLTVDATGRLWVIMGNESVTSFQAGRFELQRLPRAEPRLRIETVLSVCSNQVLFSAESSYLVRFDVAAGTNGWQVLAQPPETAPTPGSCWFDREGTLWFLNQRQGLARLRNGRFEALPADVAPAEVPVVGLTTDSEHRLWAATPHHLWLWNGAAFAECVVTNGPPCRSVLRIASSGDGGLWVLEQERLRKCVAGGWVAATPRVGFRPNLSSGLFSLYGDAQGNAWLVNYGRALWHVKADGTARRLSEREGLPSVSITDWFQDNEGNVWVGTAGGGIARVRESLFQVFGQRAGWAGKGACSVCVAGAGDLWVGSMSGGLAHWRQGGFEAVSLPLRTPSPVEGVTVFPDQDGGVWMGTLNQGLMRWNFGQATRPATPEGLGSSIRVLFGDSRGQLWVGGLVNLFQYAEGQWRHFGDAEGFVDNIAIGALAEDGAGALWIGTGPGNLWRYEQGSFTRFNPPAQWPSVRFSALLPDTNGVVWVGTLGGGLLRFQGGQFTRYMVSDGLPDNNVTQLLEGGEGNLWAGTYAGVFRVSKAELAAKAAGRAEPVACRVYRRFDGLPALECSSGFQPACWRASDGRLWFTTANGVVSVDPREVTANHWQPAVIIEDMLVDGKPHELRAANSEAPLSIGPGRHYVQFRFTGLDFAAPDSVRFRVRLDGGEPHWQDTGAQRTIGYGPLQPGAYRLRVEACNSDGLWNEEAATVAFSILPFYWETWWFKATLAAALFTGLGLAITLSQRRRYRLKLERVERQRAVESERARIARDLHDDLGTSLTQISMLSALANREQTPPEESREIIQQVRGRAREMVTALDEIVWAVNPKNDSLLELVNYLGHFAEEFFRPTSIKCRLDIPEVLPAQALSAELRHHLFLAFKEAVNNAARHSGASQVLVRVQVGNEEVLIAVEDNGKGLAASPESGGRQGNGLRNLRKRLEQVGGRAEVRSQPGQGTVVEFHLPVR